LYSARPLSGGATAWLAPLAGALGKRALVAAVIVLLFALAAHRLRAVDGSGAVAGAILSFLIIVAAGGEAFVAVAVLFCLTALSTWIGHGRKQRLGVAERRGGRRGTQVLANLGVATAAALASLYGPSGLMRLAMVAALAEAAADTVAGEIGQACGGRVYLISNFQPVRAGTDGGISLAGTVAGGVAALVVAFTGCRLRLVPGPWLAIAAAAGLLGSLVDALAGATLERRGWLSNNGVNLLSTAAGAAIALLMQL
jgi:uncharacterized protein (TIGR00297 family)